MSTSTSAASTIVASTSSALASTAPATTTTVAATAPSSTASTVAATTTTTLVTEGAVVIVANASGVPGSAGRLSNDFEELGFQLAAPTDAAAFDDLLDISKIYFLPGGEAVANSLSILMGGIAVSTMPTPAPIVDATLGLGDATVLVMLGKDQAR